MYLTEEEGRMRLGHPDNLTNVVVEIKRRQGCPPGTTRLSPAARDIVAQAARVLPPSTVAKMVGIHPRTASNLARGVTSNMSYGRQLPDVDLKASVEEAEKNRLASVKDKALELLMATLEEVDPTKIKSQVQRVKAAKDLAIIADRMKEKGPMDGVTKVLIYAPRQKSLSEFDIMDIPAKVVSG